jgi:hypothetical protein
LLRSSRVPLADFPDIVDICCPFGPGLTGEFLSGPIGWEVTVLRLRISLSGLFISVMDVSFRGSFSEMMAATPAF